MYKMSHGLLDINLEQYLILSKETRTRGSHKLKYQIPKVTKDVFKFSFFPRTLKDWNNLPEEIVVGMCACVNQLFRTLSHNKSRLVVTYAYVQLDDGLIRK